MVNAFRYGFLGTSDVNVGMAFSLMIVAVVIMFGIAVLLMNRGSGTRE
jgi:ABC-2 type transport system permease protein